VKPKLKLRYFNEILTNFMHNRPLSPHIQIYRPQITSILSITHRFTGIALVCSTLLFCAGFFAFSLGEPTWQMFTKLWKLAGGKIWQWPLIYSLHYHALNGIRHLMWDIGYGYDIRTVKKTGIAILILSFILTVLFGYFCSTF
jgi:succinate dehydrogenase / fumarate reductase cytochrome b subunit